MPSLIEERGRELWVSLSTGCLSKLALIIGLALSLVACVPVQQRGGAEWFKLLPIGLVFVAASTIWRRIIIDLNAGQVSSQFGILGFAKTTRQQSLARFSQVSVGHQWKQTDNNRHAVYYVSLSGDHSFSIWERSRIGDSRELAEDLAVRLNLPLHDSTSGGLSVVSPNQIGLSLQQRFQKDVASEPPPTFECETANVKIETNSLKIDVPSQGFSWQFFLTMLPVMAFGGFVFWIVYGGFGPDREPGERVIAVIGTLFAALCVLGPLVIVVQEATRAVSVTLSQHDLQFESRTLLLTRNRTAGLGEVLDVFAFDLRKLGYRPQEAKGVTGGIAIRTKIETLRFGDHVSVDEQQYLRNLIRHWISQGRV